MQLGKKDSTEEFSPETLLLSSSQAIVEEVAANEAAIGYLGMGYVSDRTKAVQWAKNGKYLSAGYQARAWTRHTRCPGRCTFIPTASRRA